MTPTHGPSESEAADLSREQVIAIFRDRDNEALRRHTGLPGTDGTGTFRVLCGCELGFGLEEWTVHIRAVVNSARRTSKR